MISTFEIIAKATAMFDLLNEHFYQNELPCPSIEVRYACQIKHHRKYDVCEIGRLETGIGFQIRIYDEYIYLPVMDAVSVMLHEMAHQYNMIREIKDTSGCGYYHNKRFKNTAEAHGLCVTYRKKYAWTTTSLNADAKAWLDHQTCISNFTVARETDELPQKIEKIQIWLILKSAPMKMANAKRATNSLHEIINRRIEQGVSCVEEELDFCDELDFLLECEGLRNVDERIDTVSALYDLCRFEHFWMG